MSSVELLNGLNASGPVASGQYFRATLEPFAPAWLVSSADFKKDVTDLYGELAKGAIAKATWITPLNLPTVLPGSTVSVLDIRVLNPPKLTTVAELASVLDGAKLQLSVRSLGRITSGSASPVSRDQAAAKEQEKQSGEGLPELAEKWLKRAGVTVVLLAALAIYLNSRKANG